MSNFEEVKNFMYKFGQEIKEKPEFPSDKIVQLRNLLYLILRSIRRMSPVPRERFEKLIE